MARVSAAMLATGLAASTALGQPARQAERFTLSGPVVALYDLAGSVSVKPGDGREVVVSVVRSGADGGRLQVVTGMLGGRETLRVLFPSSDIYYDRDDRSSASMTVLVRGDGTFGAPSAGGERGDARRVRISTTDGRLDARADLEVQLPAGQRLELHLGVGDVDISNVAGDLAVHVMAAPIVAERVTGTLRTHTSSGSVEVRGMEGTLDVHTTSGSVDLSRVRGTVKVHTTSGGLRLAGFTGGTVAAQVSSGSVVAQGMAVERLDIGVTSGTVRLGGVRAPFLRAHSTSGNVDVALTADVKVAHIGSSSGNITLRVPRTLAARLDARSSAGAPSVDADLPLRLIERTRTRLLADLGDASAAGGTVRLDITATSGRVRILEARE